ncbi:hypothetical protein GCM10009795_040000 [Nocardioides hankookensis]|uniref:Phage tail tube protein n=1 Tax=Nocardioides hankookensis TaxID=443157 RepID=A0ABW1LPR7_9ACTN
MSIGSGLAGSLMTKKESAFGTYPTPDKGWQITKADLKKNKNVVQGGGLAAGLAAQHGSRRVVTHESGSGSIEGLEVTNKGFGFWLEQLLGGSVAPTQQAATTAYLQSRPLVDNVGNSFTAQVGVPDAAGTVRPYTAKGCKITAATFASAVGERLMFTPTIDFRQLSEVETLVAPTIPAGLIPRTFKDLTVSLGTYGAEAPVTGVKGASLTIERPQDTERQYAGAAGLKAEPLWNDFAKVSGSITADFLDKTVFADRFASDASIAMVLEWKGPLIASTYYERITFKLPMIFFDGDSPILDGPGIVSGAFPFTAQLDGTNPLVTCEYVSVDTTV